MIIIKKRPEIEFRSAYGMVSKKEFNLFSIPIFYAYIKSIEDLEWSKHIKSIQITFYNKANLEKKDELLGNNEIIVIHSNIDLNKFWALSNDKKRTFLLNKLYDVFVFLDKEFQWGIDYTVLENGIKQTIKNNFTWNDDITKIIESPDTHRKVKIQFEYDYTDNSANVFLNQVTPVEKKIKLMKARPMLYYLERLVGKITWLNNDDLVLVPNQEFPKFKLIVSLKKDTVEVQGEFPRHTGIIKFFATTSGEIQ